jgi:hypothetical protein
MTALPSMSGIPAATTAFAVGLLDTISLIGFQGTGLQVTTLNH